MTRKCIFQKRLRFNTGKECALVKVDPPVVGQEFGLGTDIDLFVLANRHPGEGLFPVNKFPCSVHIARPLIKDIVSCEEITKQDLDLVAWGDLYRTKADADGHVYSQPAPVASPKQNSPKLQQPMRVRRIQFLAEQDGPPERELKRQLTAFFNSAQWVNAAYLVCVRYEDASPIHVALCVRGQPG